MRIYRTASEWIVDAPAKLNLFFEVLFRRPDGYHEIETLMCPVDLYDTLSFRESGNGRIDLTCEQTLSSSKGEGVPGTSLPQGPENLVYRAVDLLRKRAHVSAGAELRLVKRIPTEAGLGGGSSDAAAALCVANLGWNLGWSSEQLVPLAAELGSDVPFFLTGGAAVCRGRGERIEPVAAVGLLWFVVVRPAEGLSTAAVYQRCRPAEVPADCALMIEAFTRGQKADVGRRLVNRLQPPAEAMSPWIGRLRDDFHELDVLGHGMSGSGSSYFGLCRHARHARRVARQLQGRGYPRVFAVRSCI